MIRDVDWCFNSPNKEQKHVLYKYNTSVVDTLPSHKFRIIGDHRNSVMENFEVIAAHVTNETRNKSSRSPMIHYFTVTGESPDGGTFTMDYEMAVYMEGNSADGLICLPKLRIPKN
jgi:hypothetical protein